ncbi:MAG: hypothetical protein HC894_06230 [Microcoleus sp. SM1_3_4]|nr:hypothetical protein [Microcoleus sp. SM1_3_4]
MPVNNTMVQEIRQPKKSVLLFGSNTENLFDRPPTENTFTVLRFDR